MDCQEFGDSGPGTGNRQNQYEWKLCSWKHPLCIEVGECQKQKEYCVDEVRAAILAIRTACCNQKVENGDEQGRNNRGRRESSLGASNRLEINRGKTRVYDIRNAGRHHRFTVSGKLVHNCGYGGSTGALIAMGALEMGLKESELPDLIQDWRTANPHIVQFWWDIEKAAVETVKDYRSRRVGRIGIQYSSNTLWLQLPSGRKLAYIKPKLQPNRFGRMSITYEGLGANNKWCRQETYSGKITENITQATARDLLAEAMWRIERAGIAIVGHVHDEVILEVPTGSITVEEVCEIMNRNPDWADGIKLNSAGYEGVYYFKD